MRILVSGATGFVGGHLLTALADQHELYGLRRGPSASAPGVTWIEQDLCSQLGGLPEQIDAVVHLAQSRHYREFPARADDIYGVNVQGTFQLLEYARRAGATRFVLASTGSVYAPSDDDLSEDAPTAVTGFYAGSKLAAEALTESYRDQFATTICRLFFPYGAGQPASMLIPRLTQRVLADEPIDLHGPDGLALNPIHVSDVVRAVAGALTLAGPHLLNVAGAETLSLRQIGVAIGAATGREPRFAQQPPREPARLVGNIGRLTDVLGAPQVRFEQGIVDVCREHQAP